MKKIIFISVVLFLSVGGLYMFADCADGSGVEYPFTEVDCVNSACAADPDIGSICGWESAWYGHILCYADQWSCPLLARCSCTP